MNKVLTQMKRFVKKNIKRSCFFYIIKFVSYI